MNVTLFLLISIAYDLLQITQINISIFHPLKAQLQVGKLVFITRKLSIYPVLFEMWIRT